MALRAGLFFKGNRAYGIEHGPAGVIEFIQFDLILNETHNFSSEVTEFNVEDGSIISDHIKNNLENGSVTGLVTNFTLNRFGIVTNRAQDAFDALKLLRKERKLVTLITVMEVYNNVAITDVSVDRSSDTGEAIALNITFKKVNVVKLKSVQIDTGITVNNMETNQNRQTGAESDAGRTVGTIVQ
jgi:hypothetical protein